MRTTVDGLEILEATNVQAILSRAADLLEREGWCQGQSKNFEGRYCVLGAVDKVARPVERHAAVQELRRRLDAAYVHEWNDTRGRTLTEALAVLRQGESSREG